MNSFIKKISEYEYRLEQVVTVPEVPQHEFKVPVFEVPVSKCYALIARSRVSRCGGAGHKFRHRKCGCLSSSHMF